MMRKMLVFAACWTLAEWLRSCLLTGFPWLYLGYGHLDTPLAGWAPVFGVFGRRVYQADKALIDYATFLRGLLDRAQLLFASIAFAMRFAQTWFSSVALPAKRSSCENWR